MTANRNFMHSAALALALALAACRPDDSSRDDASAGSTGAGSTGADSSAGSSDDASADSSADATADSSADASADSSADSSAGTGTGSATGGGSADDQGDRILSTSEPTTDTSEPTTDTSEPTTDTSEPTTDTTSAETSTSSSAGAETSGTSTGAESCLAFGEDCNPGLPCAAGLDCWWHPEAGKSVCASPCDELSCDDLPTACAEGALPLAVCNPANAQCYPRVCMATGSCGDGAFCLGGYCYAA